MSHLKRDVDVEGIHVVVEYEASYVEAWDDYEITIKSVKLKDSDADISILLSKHIDECMKEYLWNEFWKDKENEHIETN